MRANVATLTLVGCLALALFGLAGPQLVTFEFPLAWSPGTTFVARVTRGQRVVREGAVAASAAQCTGMALPTRTAETLCAAVCLDPGEASLTLQAVHDGTRSAWCPLALVSGSAPVHRAVGSFPSPPTPVRRTRPPRRLHRPVPHRLPGLPRLRTGRRPNAKPNSRQTCTHSREHPAGATADYDGLSAGPRCGCDAGPRGPECPHPAGLRGGAGPPATPLRDHAAALAGPRAAGGRRGRRAVGAPAHAT